MYQVLYRKWRPQTFSDVYGQPQIVQALHNEIRSGRLAHAYLFVGSRGTGKTSCAKILAKAVNCLRPRDGDPCNECDICRGIDAGAILDVVEIDAASNNGVDNIRDLREEVAYTPSVAKYRVYIIDEVHMLSPGAFNALLKTLEEPPAHVIFILATTEVHKLPATILSRCQRFDFSRIPAEDIAARLRYVADHEEFTLTDDAALLLARLADGGLRDALSLLDQCVSRDRAVTIDTVAAATGMAGRDELFELCAAIHKSDGGAALALLDRLHGASKDMERLCVECIDFFRQLMICKTVRDPASLVVVPPAELQRLQQEAARFSLPAILHCLDALQRTLERLKAGASRRIEMEMAVLRLCTPTLDADVSALTRRVQALEDALRAGQPLSADAAGQTGAAGTAVSGTAISGTGVSAAAFAPTPAPAPADAPAVPEISSPSAAPILAAGGDLPLPPEPAGEPLGEAAGEPTFGASPLAATPAPPAADDPAAPDEQPFLQWGEVLRALATSSPALCGVLGGSTAVIRGGHILISTDNEMFKTLVSKDGNRHSLSAAIRSVTGRDYRIGLKKATAPAAPASQPDDALSAFLRHSRELGADIQIQE